jgi:NDP-sugar pyrophosphorylase family protein
MKALENLKSTLCDVIDTPILSTEEFRNEISKYVIILMAGGESSRFKEVPGATATNKSAFTLPNGDTMIEMNIKMYKNAGFKKFLVLVYHQAASIIDLIGDGSKFDVDISYSFDPDKPVGKGGAIRHAYEKGFLKKTDKFIVHNPDDVILGFEKEFPISIISAHKYAESLGCEATVVTVLETPHQFSGFEIKKGMVVDVDMYPMLPIPTHIGVTLFSESVFKRFGLFEYDKPTDFEKVLFPILSKENKLFATSIPNDAWIPVNNLKSYKLLCKRLGF